MRSLGVVDESNSLFLTLTCLVSCFSPLLLLIQLALHPSASTTVSRAMMITLIARSLRTLLLQRAFMLRPPPPPPPLLPHLLTLICTPPSLAPPCSTACI